MSPHLQSVPGSGLEDLFDTLVGLGGTLDVSLRADLLSDGQTLVSTDRVLAHPVEVLDGRWVVSEILFAGDEDDG